jgi:hypothetical protein
MRLDQVGVPVGRAGRTSGHAMFAVGARGVSPGRTAGVSTGATQPELSEPEGPGAARQ